MYKCISPQSDAKSCIRNILIFTSIPLFSYNFAEYYTLKYKQVYRSEVNIDIRPPYLVNKVSGPLHEQLTRFFSNLPIRSV